jgi:transcriptional regulator with PAS, ATPase and Fis domain
VAGQSKGTSALAVEVMPPDLNLEKMEHRFIEEALRRTHNNRTEAAELLGISRRTMQRKMAEMDLLIRKRKSE